MTKRNGRNRQESIPPDAGNPLLTRRRMIGLTIAGGVALAGIKLHSLFEENRTDPEVEQYLRELPSEIPGALEVVPTPVVGAKKCLVHIGQTHGLDASIVTALLKRAGKDPEDPANREWIINLGQAKVDKVQSSIREIVLSLKKNQGLKEVHEEQVTPKLLAGADEFMQILAEETQTLAVLEANAEATGTNGDPAVQKMMEETKAEIERTKKTLRFIAKDNAAMQLHIDRHIRLLPSGTDELSELGAKMFEDGKDDELMDELNAVRETTVMEIAENSKQKIVYVIYGNSHDFLARVRQWNSEHPKRKFAHAVIRPDGIQME